LRKIVAIFLALQLLLVPTLVFAQGVGVDVPQSEKSVDAPQLEKSMNAKISEGKVPKRSSEKEADYRDPLNYPLIGEGGFVDYLWDSYSGYQYLYFDNVTDSDYYYDYMKIQLSYYSQFAYAKDSILSIEFYQEENNYLNCVGNIEFDTYGETGLYLNSHISKANFVNKPYIYMRVGISETSYDTYYSDVVTFKVANPFYSPSNTTVDDKFAVISNESIDASSTQPTGTFSLKNIKYTLDKNLKPKAYKVDFNKPFDIPNNKEKLIQKNTKSIEQSYNQGDYKSFWVSDLEYSYDYQINARLAYSGTKSDIWVYNNQITDLDAEKLGEEFDNKIYSSVTDNFGPESDVNSDGKVNILTYDIQDGFSGSGGYVGGYFWSGDLYNLSNSNKSETFYIDTYPAMGTGSTKDVTSAYETLAHEFQHMVNFNQNVLVEKSSNSMDTWLNEGLSMAAEQIYSGQGLSERLDYYNSSTSIKNGHSLLYWDNNGDTLSNYSLSYLFAQYIKIQTNQGDRIFKEILTDPNNNYKAIENVAKKYISPLMTFGKLMTSFRIALLFNEPTGLYGFKGNSFFDGLKGQIYFGNSVDLRGGGAVVTTYNSEAGFTVPSDKGVNVTYTLFDMNEGPGEGDITPPVAPTVNNISDRDTIVIGTTEANANIIVQKGSEILGSGPADGNGKFNITIPVQQPGVKLFITATDQAGNVSEATEVNVQWTPKVNELSDRDTVVTGTAEAGSYVYVKVGTLVIGKGGTGSAGTFSVTIPLQTAGTKVSVVSRDPAGNYSPYTNVIVVDKTAPLAPKVKVISDNSTTVTGTAEVGSTVTVKVGTNVLGSAKTDETGNYSVTIPIQKAGVELLLSATDAAGNNSEDIKVIVLDKTGPLAPYVNAVTQIDKLVIGTSEPNSNVYVKVGTAVIGKGKTNSLGSFTIEIPEQPIGTKVGVVVRDEAGNYSKYTYVLVLEKVAPLAPTVNVVTNKSSTAIGTAEANSLVFVKVGSVIIGKGKTDSQGNFFVDIYLQKLRTKVSVVVKDEAGNYSPYTHVIVVEKTAPFAPKVNNVTDKSTTVAGIAETNSTVYVKVGTVVIGKGKPDSQGIYSIEIPVQQAGTKIGVLVSDEAGKYSPYTYVTVMEKTAPFAPKVNVITDQSTTVTGTAEANSTVYVKVRTVVIGSGKSNQEGNFSVKAPVQQVGTEIGIIVRDGSGKYSPYTMVTVQPE
jgi:hypothetical protein